MTTAADLDLLDQVTPLPPKQRLTELIRLLTEDSGIDDLSKALGYSNPGSMRVWLRLYRAPLRHLPGIADRYGVSLSLLASLWVTQEAEPDHAEAFFEATRPRITTPELKIVHAAREAMMENDEDAADASLARDLRTGNL